MNVNVWAIMATTLVLALGILIVGRGQLGGPWWMVLAAVLVAHPFADLLTRGEDAPGAWLRWAFQVSCGVVATSLLGPLYTRIRGQVSRSTGIAGQTGASDDHRLAA